MVAPRTKQRHKRHISGDRGVDLVRRKLPPSWVVRGIDPDYGLDLHVEVFESDSTDPDSANTAGEHFYIQVKTTDQVVLHDMLVHSRKNVAKYGLEPAYDTSMTIQVAKFPLDSATLLTVESMGAAIPVVLCYVDLHEESVYYVCLNDYLSKVLLPANPSYETQATTTVYIPSWNILDFNDPSFAYIRLLARRGKYYSAFNMFSYQLRELVNAYPSSINQQFSLAPSEASPPSETLILARTFLRDALRLGIWDDSGDAYWSPLKSTHEQLLMPQENLPQSRQAVSDAELETYIKNLHTGFFLAANLGNMYEELVREWRQPTFLAVGLDYHESNAVNPPEWPT